MRNLEDYRRARGEVTVRLVTELAQAKNKLVRSATNDFDSVLATSQIKVYEALLENALRTQAETSLSPQARGQVIDRAVPPIRRSRWSGN